MRDESKVAEIMEQIKQHNRDIGEDDPPDDWLRRVAEHVYSHRHEGISVVTLCMMLTDMERAARS